MIANSVTRWSRRVGLAAAAAVAAVPSWAASTDHPGSGGGLPQLDATTYPTQIFWLIVSFILLYIVMSKVAIPRIADVLEERQERIEDDIETADRLRGEAETVKAEYEKAVADARSQAHDLVRKAMDEIADSHAKSEAEAAKKTAETTKAAEARIAEQRTQALESLKSVASEAAAEATAKLTGLKVSDAKIGKAVEAAMQGGA
ncbi:MAG: F0F1 ATP synthase subunit B' [Thalassobaculaceae bacterium]|nr:F0F1 ATP synthase subunit B' [Thalassobaculaceae bacterium]